MGNRHISKMKKDEKNKLSINNKNNDENINFNYEDNIIQTQPNKVSNTNKNTHTNIKRKSLPTDNINNNQKNIKEIKRKIINNPLTHNSYKLIKSIGRGNYSKVYLGENFSNISKQHFAVKIMKKKMIIKTNSIKYIFNEKNVLNKIKGKNKLIVDLIEYFQDENKLYLIFPYYEIDLFAFLNELRMMKIKQDEFLFKFILAQIYLAISFLHENGIIYRDMKPENIVIDTETGYIKLIDFGLSKDDITDDSEISEVCGTNEYIPSEVCKGEKYNFNFDWWGFGIFMYEIFFGRPPFTGKTQIEVFDKIINEEINFKIGGNISKDAKDLISYLLHKDLDRRINPEQIPFHPFFKEIDFDKLKDIKIESPILKILNKFKIKNKLVFVDYIKKEDLSEINVDQDLFKDF